MSARELDAGPLYGEGLESPTGGLLGEGRGEDFAQYADRYGRVRLWHFDRRIGVLESSGGIVGEHAKFIVDYFGRYLDRAPVPRYAICNWLSLTAYTAEVRRILTDWQIVQSYEGVHVAQTSKLLAMSVAVANSVLKREIRTYEKLEEVHNVFQLTMVKHGLYRALGSTASLQPVC